MKEQFSLFDFDDEIPEAEPKNTPAIKETETEKKFFVSCGLLSEKIFYSEKKPPLTNEYREKEIIIFLTDKINLPAWKAEEFLNAVKKDGEKIYSEYDGYSIF